MDREPEFEEDHPDKFAHVWPSIADSIPKELHPWLNLCLPIAWEGETVISLLMIEHPGSREFHWQIAGMEFVTHKTLFLNLLKPFFNKHNVRFPNEHPISIEEQRFEKFQWKFHLNYGGVTKIECLILPSRLVGRNCSIPGCEGQVRVMGFIRTGQLTFESEMRAYEGIWTGKSNCVDVRRYCGNHAVCRHEEGINVHQPCRGPLRITTTRLSFREGGGSGDELHGNLFCNVHSPPGPRHMIFIK